ncbi:hypothetical protein C8R44DRAFT_749297 [Mycena epipterygia]|nr:hypothetical protein C8R44DRAFT_749297 [Mycena epipterygia]
MRVLQACGAEKACERLGSRAAALRVHHFSRGNEGGREPAESAKQRQVDWGKARARSQGAWIRGGWLTIVLGNYAGGHHQSAQNGGARALKTVQCVARGQINAGGILGGRNEGGKKGRRGS